MQINKKALIPVSALSFLKSLKKNNNREWFTKHKETFLEQQSYIVTFADSILYELNKHDVIETTSGKKSLHRIYRDTRFSKEKIPYKNNWSGSFTRATKYRRGGYYFHIEPGNSFIAGGFWSPNVMDIRLIRDDIDYDSTPLRKIIKARSFVSTFGTLGGEQLKTAPRDFDVTNEAIDLLRYKQFLLIKKFTNEEILSPSFLKKANQTFKKMRPFLDYMSEVLTTDLNGQPV